MCIRDSNTGNNTYKAVQQSAGAVAVGPVLQGLNKAVNDLSRGTTVADTSTPSPSPRSKRKASPHARQTNFGNRSAQKPS